MNSNNNDSDKDKLDQANDAVNDLLREGMDMQENIGFFIAIMGGIGAGIAAFKKWQRSQSNDSNDSAGK